MGSCESVYNMHGSASHLRDSWLCVDLITSQSMGLHLVCVTIHRSTLLFVVLGYDAWVSVDLIHYGYGSLWLCIAMHYLVYHIEARRSSAWHGSALRNTRSELNSLPFTI